MHRSFDFPADARAHRQMRIMARSLLSMVLVAGCAGASTSPASSSAPQPAPSTSSTPPSSPSLGSSSPTVSPSTPDPSTPVATARATSAPKWIATPRVPAPHAFHAAVLLEDGSVLVSGGLLNDQLGGRVSAASELYEPVQSSWTAQPD